MIPRLFIEGRNGCCQFSSLEAHLTPAKWPEQRISSRVNFWKIKKSKIIFRTVDFSATPLPEGLLRELRCAETPGAGETLNRLRSQENAATLVSDDDTDARYDVL
jgi:hypothetical protein